MAPLGWRKKRCKKCGCAFWCAPTAPAPVCMDCQIMPFLIALGVLFVLFILFLLVLFFPYYMLFGSAAVMLISCLTYNKNKTNKSTQENKSTTEQNMEGAQRTQIVRPNAIPDKKSLTTERFTPITERIVIKKSPVYPVGTRSFKQQEYTQEEFDSELRTILQEAKSEGKQFCKVVSKDLHHRVVGGSQPNQMPMACEAMWKLWKKQGGYGGRIFHTTPSTQFSTITIGFSTGLNRKPNSVEEKKASMPCSAELEAFIDDLIDRAKKEGYNSNMFIDMRNMHGTLKAMEKMAAPNDVQNGFVRLELLGLLDLSFEESVLKFPEKFTAKEREIAEWRLEQVRKDFGLPKKPPQYSWYDYNDKIHF